MSTGLLKYCRRVSLTKAMVIGERELNVFYHDKRLNEHWFA